MTKSSTISTAHLKKLSRNELVTHIERLYRMKELGGYDDFTVDDVRKELTKVARELKRRGMNVVVEKQIAVQIDAYINTKSSKIMKAQI